MRNRVIALGTGLLIFLTACVAETITMPQETKEVYVVDQDSVEQIDRRLDAIEKKIDSLAVNYAQNDGAVETLLNVEEQIPFTDEEIMLMARVVQAEYGNGEEIDKRMIVSVILNRLENTSLSDFRNLNTVESVVLQKNQFVLSPQDRVTLETIDCVYKEIRERTDYRVLWFKTGGYPSWGEPIMKVNSHYFSGVKGEQGE